MRVQAIHEVTDDAARTGWTLWLQYCRYINDDGSVPSGYRFIWKRPGGALQPARGQARIPSLARAERLIALAKAAGWGDLDDNGPTPRQ